MMIESDMLYAIVKTEDWLKPAATSLVKKMVKGQLGTVCASRESLHELYYTSAEEGVSIDDYIGRVASLTSLPNLRFLNTNYEIDILALTLMKQFKLTSIFDAYYAATCLSMVEDKTIVSTDEIYDRVSGLTRLDPRTMR
jgi:predicted nucleic acid-binding protein